MLRLRPGLVVVAVLVAPLPVAHAQAEPDRLALKVERELRADRDEAAPTPVFVQGRRIEGQAGAETRVEGDAELRKHGSTIKADRITYVPVDDRLEADGHVRLLRAGDRFDGTELRLRLDARTGHLLSVDYLLDAAGARGKASRFDFLGPDAYAAKDATYTTCGPGRDDWFLEVGNLKLDFGRDLGEAEDARLKFMGQQILYVPSMSFTLNDRRKSGFLSPTFGSSIQNGQEVQIPYYWNIAPNRDLTVTPRYMSKRGLQTSGAFRYLGDDYRGELRAEVLPNDEQTRTTRSGFTLLHYHNPWPGVTGYLNINKVSDATYFTDLSNRISATSQTFLPREGWMQFNGQGYGLYVRALSYQTLQDPLSPVADPYRRLPQVTFSTSRYDVGGFDLGFAADYNRFSHPTLVNGERVVVNPSISYPLLAPGAFLIPRFMWHGTVYSLSNQTPGTPDRFTRSLPVASVDGGLRFERPTEFMGSSYTQTLEPRMFYLRVPARDQSALPVFDTGLATFNYAQLFSENVYSGGDRFADANQTTVAVTSRLLDAANGRERARFTFGQRFYFTEQRVTLPGETPRSNRTSDLLLAAGGEVLPRLNVDSTLQYDPDARMVKRVSHGAKYSPEDGRTIYAAYRYQRDFLEQIDFASQWRFAGGWYAVGRYNYSLREGRVVEALGGLEYDGDCWVGRVVLQRFAVATGRASTGIFVQVELNGLSRLGSNPIETLRRNIPGYVRPNQRPDAAPRGFSNFE